MRFPQRVRAEPGRLTVSGSDVASYGVLGQVPPRLPTIFFQLSLEPHEVYNGQLYLVLFSHAALKTREIGNG